MSLPSFVQDELQRLDDIFGMGFIIEEEYQERRKQLFENAGIPDPKQNSTTTSAHLTDSGLTSPNETTGFNSSTDLDYNAYNTYNISQHTDTYIPPYTIPDYGTDHTTTQLDSHADPYTVPTTQTYNYDSNQSYTPNYNDTYDSYHSQTYSPSNQSTDLSSNKDSTTESRQQSYYANFSSQKNTVVVYRRQIYGVQQSLPLSNPTAAIILEYFSIPITSTDYVLVQSKTNREITLNGFSNEKISPGSYLLQEKPTLVHRSLTSFLIHGNSNITRPQFNPLEAFRGMPTDGHGYQGSYPSSYQPSSPTIPKLDERTKKAISLGCMANQKGISSLNQYLEFCREQYLTVDVDRQPQNPDEVTLLLHSNGDARSRGELIEESRGKEYSLSDEKFGYAPTEALQSLFGEMDDSGVYRRKPKQVVQHKKKKGQAQPPQYYPPQYPQVGMPAPPPLGYPSQEYPPPTYSPSYPGSYY